ncbi:MAG: hypothetical protein QW585_02290 [Candidatus Pacearchaeota archaeon]
MILEEMFLKKLDAIELPIKKEIAKDFALENFKTIIKEIKNNPLAKQIYGPKIKDIDENITFDGAVFLQSAIPLIEREIEEKERPYRKALIREGYRIINKIIGKPLDENFVEEYKDKIESLKEETEFPEQEQKTEKTRLKDFKEKYFLYHTLGHGFAIFSELKLINLINPELKTKIKELLPAYNLLSNLYRLTHFMRFSEEQRQPIKKIVGRAFVHSIAEKYEDELTGTIKEEEIIGGRIQYKNFFTFMHELGEAATRVLNPLLLNYTIELKPEDLEEIQDYMKEYEDLSYILGPKFFELTKRYTSKEDALDFYNAFLFLPVAEEKEVLDNLYKNKNKKKEIREMVKENLYKRLDKYKIR